MRERDEKGRWVMIGEPIYLAPDATGVFVVCEPAPPRTDAARWRVTAIDRERGIVTFGG